MLLKLEFSALEKHEESGLIVAHINSVALGSAGIWLLTFQDRSEWFAHPINMISHICGAGLLLCGIAGIFFALKCSKEWSDEESNPPSVQANDN